MSEGMVRHITQQRSNTRTVWLLGTDTIERGYALCYDQDATENGTTPEDTLGFTVEKPATANIMFFAGLYSGEQGSFTGPGYITIDVPVAHEMIEAWIDDDITIATSGLACQNGQYGMKIHADSGANFPLVALACKTESLDSSNALSTVMWL